MRGCLGAFVLVIIVLPSAFALFDHHVAEDVATIPRSGPDRSGGSPSSPGPAHRIGPPAFSPFFTENLGQMGPGAGRYYCEGDPVSAAFGEGWMAFRLVDGALGPDDDGATAFLYRVRFEGAGQAMPMGMTPLGHRSNFIVGADPSAWVMGARSYSELVYGGIWDGIDLRFRFEGGFLKYDVTVRPGADPSLARFSYEDVTGLSVDPSSGDLEIGTPLGVVRDAAPLACQDGTAVDCSFSLLDARTVSFEVGRFDASRPLVIDPGIALSTYVGGPGDDLGYGLAVNAEGGVLVAGSTLGAGFPTTGGAFCTTKGGQDAFILKLDANLSKLVYSTYVGSSAADQAIGLAVDDAGCPCIVGTTAGPDFPTTAGAYNTSLEQGIFVFKLDATGGDVRSSTMIPSGAGDIPFDIAIDPSGDIVVGGTSGYWLVGPSLPITTGAFDTTLNGTDGFALKLSGDLSELRWCTYFGGAATDWCNDLAIGPDHSVYLVGSTEGNGFPVTTGAYDTTVSGYGDSYVLRLDENGTRAIYSTFIGGEGFEEAVAVTVDDAGCAFVLGKTQSASFPVSSTAFQRTIAGGYDGYVLKMSASGESLVYSTLLGGNREEYVSGIHVDADGHAHVLGTTYSSDFPTTSDAISRGNVGVGLDLTYTELDAGGDRLLYSTYLGGTDDDEAADIFVDDGHTVFLLAISESIDYPTSPTACGQSNAGSNDVVVTVLDLRHPVLGADATPMAATTGDELAFNVSAVDNLAVAEVSVEYWQGDLGTHADLPLSLVNGTARNGTWSGRLTLPAASLEPLHYIVGVEDLAANVVQGPERTVTVRDDDPAWSRDATDARPTTGDPFDLRAEVTDNIGVRSVHAVYWFGDGTGATVNASMTGAALTGLGNGTYELLRAMVPPDSIGPLRYAFAVEDLAGNWNTSGQHSLNVTDNDMPRLLGDLSGEEATTGDAFAFRVNVLDNVAISSVRATYWFGADTGARTDVRLVRGEGLPNGSAIYVNDTVTMGQSFLGAFSYLLTVCDTSGNAVTGAVMRLQVRDNDPPVIVDGPGDGIPTTGEEFAIVVDVGDNIGVDEVSLSYWYDGTIPYAWRMSGVDLWGQGNGTYSYVIDVTAFERGPLFYCITLADLSWNKWSTGTVRLDVMDDDPPWFEPTEQPADALKGMPLELVAVAKDNVGVAGVFLRVVTPDGQVQNLSMVLDGTLWRATVDVPRRASGAMGYSFHARDAWDNWAAGPEGTIPLVNSPPHATAPPAWEVVEGTESTLDLGSFVTDMNDPVGSLTVSCEDPDITVEGFVLHANVDAWVPPRPLTINISDGEDWTTVLVNLVIQDTNDPPASPTIVSPIAGTRFKVGAAVTLNATFADPDLVEGKDLEVVWHSSLSGEIARYRSGNASAITLTDLPAGDHLITVTVSDGQYERSASTNLTVYGPSGDGRKGFLGDNDGTALAAMTMLVAASALLIARRRH
jgi:hypothetical protein